MKTPQDKVVVYMIVSVITLVFAYWVLALILGGIFLSMFGLGLAAGTHMGGWGM
jgi:hypothetical protein